MSARPEILLPGPSAYVDSRVVCGGMPSPVLLAYTDMAAHTIVLGEGACWGILELWQDPEGILSEALNPGHDLVLLEAEGALALMHERGHLLYGLDEVKAECYGLSTVSALLAKRRVPSTRQQRIMADVELIDAQLGDSYHGLCQATG